ncbi:MAG TPA: NAD(P)H-hydrate dehydratase [Arthrobacter sp.]|nr:NAD(P)H-hydrate dehydratase [Arthrobacter sp.]
MSTPAEKRSPTPITPNMLRKWRLPGPGNKYERGSVLVLGGARRTPGAAMLAGISALRVGAGRLTLAVSEAVAVQLAVAVPEAGVVGLPEVGKGSVRWPGTDALSEELDAADVVLIGPGLDSPNETRALLKRFLAEYQPGGSTCLVLDAYALGVLPDLGEDLQPWGGRVILTPNSTEASYLLGRETGDPVMDAVEIARKYGAVVASRGVVAEGDGAAAESEGPWELTTGYGGLGTSGSGDVLAGAVAGLRARGTTEAQAACWGSHLHASAGDRLASRKGSVGYLARELADELPPLMMELGT